MTTLATRLTQMERRQTDPLPLLHLTTAADVLTLLEEAVHTARTDASARPLERARVLGSLAGIATKVIEAKDLQARVDALEQVLKARTGPAPAHGPGARR